MNKFAALAAALLMAGAPAAHAVKAKPGVRTMEQPDGTTIDVVLHGDEHFHFYTTADGYLIEQADGRFYYSEVDEATGLAENSHRVARDADKRPAPDVAFLRRIGKSAPADALAREHRRKAPVRRCRSAAAVYSGEQDGFTKGPGLFPGTTVPSLGEQKGLVILVEYSDVRFNLDDPADYFTRMLNQEGFSDYGGTGSARDYFIASSGGLYTPTFDVYGPVTLPYSRSYYGGNNFYGDDRNPEMMVIHACDMLDSSVDFSQYDSNDDGEIDFVYLFYAGFGEADGGPADSVWPHAWSLESSDHDVSYDGVRLNNYACSHEWQDGSYSRGAPAGIGTFCHEFGHVLGLADHYPTAYSGAFSPGEWDIMDHGSYNNDQRTPPVYSGFERHALGWIEPVVITGPADGRLTHMSGDEPVCYKIPAGSDNEFFILENRQQTGWDSHLPHHGMLIWHIAYDEKVWADNTVNNLKNRQYVDIEEADNIQTNVTVQADPFPGTGNVTSFTDDTRPSMRNWANKALNLPVTDIAEDSGIITFKVAGGSDDSSVELPPVSDRAGVSCSVSGHTICIGAPAGAVFTVADASGRIVASAKGACRIDIPAAGLYFVNVSGTTFKVSIR